MTARIDIGIAGAGVAGLAAAALLARAGHRVTVADRFETPMPVGSGLVIQPVGLAVLDRMGAGDAARALGNPIHRMRGHEADSGRQVLDVHYRLKGRDFFGLAIHRAALFDCLWQAARTAGVALRPGAEVRAAPPGGTGRWLETVAGRLGPFDLVLDCSGARSTLSPLVARPLPYGAIWGTVPWPGPGGTDLSPTELTQCYRKASRMAGVLPLGRLPGDPTPLAAIFWSMPRPALAGWAACDPVAWKAEAGALWPGYAPFLETITEAGQMLPASYGHGTLRRPVGDRIAYLGDAAHRASPQLGQGANMALLDALALVLALEAAEGAEALALYARMRRWHVRLYQTFSVLFTPQYQSDSLLLPVLRDRGLMPLSRLWPLPRVLNRLVCGDLIPPLAGVAFP
ncbi:FAD-dependent oxidoreductase [Frigidibacter sp. ROC022]|uniref:FAD-dependent oxidoreductase n=1 Tax=Frigidibacter sp. ROC022 TaxID=2971796 RepID=UPI00215B662C|nr:NAD(P)/FAD-dependent oxidoreductase [Frigidibacter sp. ROC022]MCR8725117.1 FAD-dependent monooxygenase [Frigidibacter sp. ROC022]